MPETGMAPLRRQRERHHGGAHRQQAGAALSGAAR